MFPGASRDPSPSATMTVEIDELRYGTQECGLAARGQRIEVGGEPSPPGVRACVRRH